MELKGKTVVVTGTFGRPRKEIEALVESFGAKLSGSVSKKTDLVFAGVDAGSKLEKAQALGVPVFSESALLALLETPKSTIRLPTISDGGAAILEAIKGLDWASFDPLQHGEALRDLLLALEKTDGIGEAHRIATEALLPKMEIQHGSHHQIEVGSVGISPDGRYFATGSWVGDDYDEGGHLVIWDVRLGRPVNAMTVRGGVGWPDYPNCIQWSPDGKRIGMAYDTNGVGSLDPFGNGSMIAECYITDGWSRPPGWCWSPDSRQFYVACWGPNLAYGAFLQADITRPKPRWVESAADENGDATLEPVRQVRWGEFLVGWSTHDQLVRIDPKTAKILYRQTSHRPVAFSPDVRSIAMHPAGLVVYEGSTGLPDPHRTLMHVGAEAFCFSPDGKRLAALIGPQNDYGTEPGVHIYDGGTFRYGPDLRLAPMDYEQDAPVFAWAPDNRRAACLCEDGILQIWDLGENAEKIGEHSVSGVMGVFWGADETLVLWGPDALCFLRTDGTVIGRFSPATASSGESPLRIDDIEWGRPFVIDADRQASLLGPYIFGPITENYDRLLTYVLARRIVWPLRWKSPTVVADPVEVLSSLPAALQKRLKKAPPKKAKSKVWPPKEPRTIEDLLRIFRECIALMGMSYHRPILEWKLCRFLRKLGRSQEIPAILEQMPPGTPKAMALSELAIRCPDPAQARIWLDEASFILEEQKPEYRGFAAEAGVAAGWRLLGEPEKGEAFLKDARSKTVYNGEEQAFAGWAIWKAGDLKTALALCFQNSHPWGRDTNPWFHEILEKGDEAEIFAFIQAANAVGRQEFEQMDAGALFFVDRGRYADAKAWLGRFPQLSTVNIQRRIIERAWSRGDKEIAWNLILDQRQVSPETAGPLLMAASFDPERARPLVAEMIASPPNVSVNYREYHTNCLAEAALRCGLTPPAEPRAALLRAIIRVGPLDSTWDSAFSGLRTHAKTLSTAFNDLCHFIEDCLSRNRVEEARILAEDARTLVPLKNRDLYQEQLLNSQAKAGDIAGAYETVLTMTKGKRAYRIREFIRICADRKNLEALADLLMTLPADVNNRTQAAEEVLERLLR